MPFPSSFIVVHVVGNLHIFKGPNRRVLRLRLFLSSFVLYMSWIPGEHRRGIRAVECVTAHLRGFEEDSRSEVNLTCSTGPVISLFVCTVHAVELQHIFAGLKRTRDQKST